MDIATRVIGVRYAYRTLLHEDGEGTDGVVVLQETDGTRHAVILFQDALGTELLEALHRHPGDPILAHELFVDLLRSVGASIGSLRLEHFGDGEERPCSVTVVHNGNSVSRGSSMFDLVGLSLAAQVPIHVDAEMFAKMHEAAPPLDEVMSNKGITRDAEMLALSADASVLGKA